MNIPIYDPAPEYDFLKDEIDESIQAVLSHGQFILGPEVRKFEKKAAKYLGVKHAVGVNSGTDALVIALRSLDIGAGDEVITTAMSFFATAESISMVGAKPVFVDIEGETFNIDAAQIEGAITSSTKAIIPVHLFGLPAPMAEIMELARRYNLKVIEDCAQSFGARYLADGIHFREKGGDNVDGPPSKGKHTGSIGHCGTFSFFPTKNLGGIGDGGLIVTDDEGVANKARMLRVHGAQKKYHNEMFGYNSRLDTIQAAALLVKLDHIDSLNAKRQEAAARYNQKLEKAGNIGLPKVADGHVFHQYTIRTHEKHRDALRNFLQKHGVQTNIYFPVPQNELPVYDSHPVLERAHQMSRQVLSLPIWPHITEAVQNKVIETIFDYYR